MNLFTNTDVEKQLYVFKQPMPGCNRLLSERSCVCCHIYDVPFLKLSSCTHDGYLKCNFSNKINFRQGLLCYTCHAMLKKINAFKNQVEKCLRLKQETFRCTNLQISHIVTTSFYPEDVKPVLPNAVFIPESVPEIPEKIPDIKDEYLSDESTKSAFEFNFEDKCQEVEISREKNAEEPYIPNTMPLREPNSTSEILDHNYNTQNSANKSRTTEQDRSVQNVKSKSYQCEICLALFAEEEHMLYHQTKHDQPLPRSTKTTQKLKKIISTVKKTNLLNVENIYQCALCPASFDAEAALENHRQEHERVRFARSDLYGKIRMVYLTRKELETERGKLRETQYAMYQHKCHYCLKSYGVEESLKLHMKRHDKKRGKYVCSICECVFTSETCAKQHEDLHWRRYQCMECGERFLKDRKCIEHFNKAHARDGNRIDDYYACRHLNCEFIAADFTSYKRHLRQTHSKNVPCDECGRVFPNARTMRYHKSQVHEKVSTCRQKCQHCHKTYASLKSLSYHVRSQHKLIPDLEAEILYCKTCDKQFKDRACLHMHLKYNSKHITEDLKKYTCDYCNAKFVNKTGIESHIEMKHLSHTFQCEQCNKVVSCSRALRKHLKEKHSDTPKPVVQTKKLCQICGKGFKHTPSLISHLHTHAGERPLKCTRCPATFVHKASLYTHNRLVHKVPKKGVKK